jgi:hypothetical protein
MDVNRILFRLSTLNIFINLIYLFLADEKLGMEDVTLLGTVTIFLLYAPLDIATCVGIRNQCIEMFNDTWSSHSYEVNLSHMQIFAAACLPIIKGPP